MGVIYLFYESLCDLLDPNLAGKDYIFGNGGRIRTVWSTWIGQLRSLGTKGKGNILLY